MTVIDLNAYRTQKLPARVYTVADWLQSWQPPQPPLPTYHRILVHGDVRLSDLAIALSRAGLVLGNAGDGSLTISPKDQ